MDKLTLSATVGVSGVNQHDDVLNVQKALNLIANKIGLKTPLIEDGSIGEYPARTKTCQAIALMQKTLLGYQNPDMRIDVDGKSYQAINNALSGEQTDEISLFLPKIVPQEGITEEAYQQASQLLACEVPAIKAVSDVESSGSGYFSNGTPCLLFEAQHFSKLTNHQYDESHPDISSPNWNRSLYIGGIKEYMRLQKAMMLNRNAALQSASYGRYQIMGFNHQAAGYAEVESFVRDMFLAEPHHLIAFVNFIKSNKFLLDAIQQKDWPTFARYYNGSAYAKNQYDVKLKNAYEQHAQ